MANNNRGQQVLFDAHRRPDLQHMLLNCENTNTSLPYIDLVNEIFEQAIVQHGVIQAKNTTWTQEELSANPEHVLPNAYDKLKTALYPWTLPFDPDAAEARIYLEHLGTTRHQLMQTFHTGDPLSDLNLAAEYLELTEKERQLLDGVGQFRQHELWGVQPGESLDFLRLPREVLQRTGLTLTELEEALSLGFVNAWAAHPSLRITYGEACSLDDARVNLNTDLAGAARLCRFVRLCRKLGWSMCELDVAPRILRPANSIGFIPLLILSHVQRLREQLRLSVVEVLALLGPLAQYPDKTDRPALYERVYLSKLGLHPETDRDTRSVFSALNATQQKEIQNYIHHIAASLGVKADDILLICDWLEEKAQLFSVKREEYIGLQSLSLLYRLVKLAKALRYKVWELLTVIDLMGIGPVSQTGLLIDILRPFTTTELLRLLGAVEHIKNSGFDIDEIDYLLRHRLAGDKGVEAALSEQAILLANLHNGLRKIEEEFSSWSSDPQGTLLQQRLGQLLPPEMVVVVMQWVRGELTPDAACKVALDDALQSVAAGRTPPFSSAELETQFSGATSDQDKFEFVLDKVLPWPAEAASRSFIKQHLAEALALETELAEKLLEQWVNADGLAPDTPAIDAFLNADFVQSDAALVCPTYPEQQQAAETFRAQFRTLLRLQKAAHVLSRLAITAREASYLFAPQHSDWLDPRVLPLDPAPGDADSLWNSQRLFSDWTRLVDVCQLRNRVGTRQPRLFELFEFVTVELNSPLPDKDAVFSAVAERMGWNSEDFATLREHFGPNEQLSYFANEVILLRFEKCFRLAARLGVSITAPPSNQQQPNLLYWLKNAYLADAAKSIKLAARARHGSEDMWVEVVRPLQDELRERRRTALVAYLTSYFAVPLPVFEAARPVLHLRDRGSVVRELQRRLNAAGAQPRLIVDGTFGKQTYNAVVAFQQLHHLMSDGIVGPATWQLLDQLRVRVKDANALYEHFLIDPEMSACMLTSRIKQGIGSVQLFIQRIFLGLEDVKFLHPEDAKTQWEWMKNYRVWEANRRIFLYPENWIEPELRDDKSPFFKELENELRQNEITSEYVEKVYLNYLHKLDTVSNLEIVGQCYGPDGKLHIFGRTRDTPHVYYYRYRDEYKIWSPWEKVNVDIEGDHLLPIVWNRRLYLFWPVFKETGEKPTVSTKVQPGQEAKRYWTIQLAWSHYWQGGWTPKKILQNGLVPMAILRKDGEIYDWAKIFIVDRTGIRRFNAWKDWESEQEPWLALLPYHTQKSLFYFNPRIVDTGCLQIDVYYPKHNQPVDHPDLGWFSQVEIDEYWSFGSFLVMPNELRTVAAEGWNTSPQPNTERYGLQNMAVFGRGLVGFKMKNRSLPLFEVENENYRLLLPYNEFSGGFVYSDSKRTIAINLLVAEVMYHPYVGQFIQALFRDGIDGLLRPSPNPLFHADLYRQRVVKPIFGNQTSLTNRNPEINVSQPISYPGPHPEILKPREDITFEDQEAYSLYNWELFFHIPLLIADRLSKNQQFEAAMKWFHYIFDPLTPDANDRFEWQRPWKFGRFYDNGDATRSIEELMTLLSKESVSSHWFIVWEVVDWYFGSKRTPEASIKQSLVQQIDRWRLDPFKPHLLARLRITPYMKTVVMKYLDNLIAWADQLFRRDTIESINEATQLYILAAQLLGPRHQELPEREHKDHTYAELKDHLDMFSNALEDEIPDRPTWSILEYAPRLASEAIFEPNAFRATTMRWLLSNGSIHSSAIAMTESGVDTGIDHSRMMYGTTAPDSELQPISPSPWPWMAFDRSPWPGMVFDRSPSPPPAPSLPPPGLFFCIPQNETLLSYWDTVADRLFKIRHCMNIEGLVRELPLFQPPIEPGLLVRAAAAGVDFSSVLNDLSTPAPHYRFSVMAQKAAELCQEVKSLGAALLAALEKRDAEGLALLRSEHEIQMLEMVREIRKQQIQEAQEAKASLEIAKSTAEIRKEHFVNLLGGSDRDPEKRRIPPEKTYMEETDECCKSN